ncbi:MAG: TetR/AcrR family transcriptional regulator [Vicinamibacterales bacterium]
MGIHRHNSFVFNYLQRIQPLGSTSEGNLRPGAGVIVNNVQFDERCYSSSGPEPTTEIRARSPRGPMTRQARQREHREANRRAILDAALELFVAHGYADVSIRSIASRAEYSPAAIYAYFPSKDDIFFALAEEGFRLLGAPSMACTAASDRPLDDVRATVWRLYEFSTQHPEYFALVFLDRRVPRIGREYERFAFTADMRARVLAQIARCVEVGELPAALSPRVALRLLSAPILGLAAMRLSNRLAADEDADALARDAIDTVIAGLRAGAVRHSHVSSTDCPTACDASHAMADPAPSPPGEAGRSVPPIA